MTYVPPPGLWSPLEVEHQELIPFVETKKGLVSADYLVVVRKGSVSYCARNAPEMRAHAPALLFFPAGELRGYGHTQNKSGKVTTMRIRNRCFGIEPEADGIAWGILRSLTRYSRQHGNLLPISADIFRFVQHEMEAMMRIQKEAPFGFALSLKCHGARILLSLAQSGGLAQYMPMEDPEPRKPQAMRNVLLYLDEHFPDRICVDEMAKLACLSRSHFQSLFREETGLPMMQYLTRLRVARACAALRDPSKTILEVCHTHGFGSSSRMYAAFQTYVGKSPGSFR